MNKAIITGRLGENAEIIDTKNGKIMIKLVVATRDFDEVDWHQVKIVRQDLAQTCKKCLKGQTVSISGKLKTKKFTDRNGSVHHETYINAEEVIFVSALEPNKVSSTEALKLELKNE